MTASTNHLITARPPRDASRRDPKGATARRSFKLDDEATALTRRVRAPRIRGLLAASGALGLLVLAGVFYAGYTKVEEGVLAQEQRETALAEGRAQIAERESELARRDAQIADLSRQLVELRPALAAADEEIRKARIACEQSEPAALGFARRAADARLASAARTTAR